MTVDVYRRRVEFGLGVCAVTNITDEDLAGSFRVISTQKKPDPLGFLRKLVTIRYLHSN